MMETNEHIALDDFDREYGLIDLLPSAMAAQVLGNVNGNVHFAIFLPDGGCHFNGNGAITTGLHDAAPNMVQAGGGFIRSNDGDESTVVLPLIHEMDTVGFLVAVQKQSSVSFDLMALGRFAVACIERIMHLNYRLRLTSGLHGHVVEASYASLKEKASALQASEAKYRALAQNLEAEVKRKTKKIKAAQLAMLQQEKLASIGQLAAGMAHEINNPIGFIVSNLTSLKTYLSDLFSLIERYDRLIHAWEKADGATPAHRPLYGKIKAIQKFQQELDLDFVKQDSDALILESLEGGERIKSIVQDLREFAHPSVKTAETVDFNHCLDTTLTMLSGKISNGVSIKKEYTDIPVVTCYLRDMNQVFFNIILNALQAMGSQGQLTLSTRVCGDGWVQVGISDTGPGIHATSMARIFEPFYTTRQVGEGIGLGLYLAYNIVKSHNGTIEVESNEGVGSTFRVKIPAKGS